MKTKSLNIFPFPYINHISKVKSTSYRQIIQLKLTVSMYNSTCTYSTYTIEKIPLTPISCTCTLHMATLPAGNASEIYAVSAITRVADGTMHVHVN